MQEVSKPVNDNEHLPQDPLRGLRAFLDAEDMELEGDIEPIDPTDLDLIRGDDMEAYEDAE